MSNKIVALIAFLSLVLLLFFPIGSNFISISLLLIIAYSKKVKNKHYILIFILSISIISIVIASASKPLFNSFESDFVNYYNNYRYFLHGGFNLDYFEFAKGIEFLLPLMNYLFSLIIQEPYPYIVFVLFSFSILLGLVFLSKKISDYYNLTLSQRYILLGFMLIFYKFGTATFYLRQTFSSLLILYAIFTKTKKKYIYLGIAFFFHISTIIVYPIAKTIILGNKKQVYLLGGFFIIFSSVMLLGGDKLLLFVLADNSILAIKLHDFIAKVINNNLEDLKRLVFATLNIAIYFIFLLLSMKILKIKSEKIKLNLYLVILIIITLSFLPGLSLRLLNPIISFMIGFFFFKVLYDHLIHKQSLYIILVLFFLFQIKWFSNASYYYNYKVMDYHPLYYLDNFLIKRDYWTNKRSLPKSTDIRLKNENKF